MSSTLLDGAARVCLCCLPLSCCAASGGHSQASENDRNGEEASCGEGVDPRKTKNLSEPSWVRQSDPLQSWLPGKTTSSKTNHAAMAAARNPTVIHSALHPGKVVAYATVAAHVPPARLLATREEVIGRITQKLANPPLGIENAAQLRPFFEQCTSWRSTQRAR